MLTLPTQTHSRYTTLLTNNGVQLTLRAQDIHDSGHIFGGVCAENGIEHRLTRIGHPWTNGQVERMNRTIKEVTAS
ncbi:integrase core domain-containing protein [Fodinicurvata fenggangensis]|uniref:integrase core domain-containing protein n=1 Tax=Fodinicurvata fenggangensis TaxID=1121830 RepID=UPI0012DD24D5